MAFVVTVLAHHPLTQFSVQRAAARQPIEIETSFVVLSLIIRHFRSLFIRRFHPKNAPGHGGLMLE
jgi:hypothetical protein